MSVRLRLLLVACMLPGVAMAQESVSYFHEVAPVLKRNCHACHRPGKAKGGLDLTSFAALRKGGKEGEIFKPGAPEESSLIESISGEEPAMPEEGEPLTAEERSIIERWIAQGGKDDTPANAGRRAPATPPVYRALPAVTALAWSPDGSVLAVAGHHEVLLRSGDGAEIVARLVGESPRIESLAFSLDGKLLAVAGGAPSEYGEIQIWDVAERKLLRSIRTTLDTVYGVSLSADARRVAVGCADKTVRAFDVVDGREVMRCDNHIDWVFATAFSLDGARLTSVSRDRALKLIDVATGHLIDDISKPREPLLCLARSPREDIVVCGSDTGGLRLYKMEPRGGRLAEGDDKENSFVREFDRMNGPVHALAFSPDGRSFAATGGGGEARVYQVSDGKRLCTFTPKAGAIFALAFHPTGRLVAIAGSDGRIRFFDAASGQAGVAFDSVPLGDPSTPGISATSLRTP